MNKKSVAKIFWKVQPKVHPPVVPGGGVGKVTVVKPRPDSKGDHGNDKQVDRIKSDKTLEKKSQII